MHCDSCGGLFEYNEQVVALTERNGERLAGFTIEKEGDAIAETFQPVGRPLLRRDAQRAAGRLARAPLEAIKQNGPGYHFATESISEE